MKKKIVGILIVAMIFSLFNVSGIYAQQSQNTSEEQSTEENVSKTYDEAYNESLLNKTFKEIYEAGKLTWDNENVTVDDSLEEGILIEGKNKDLSTTEFTINENYDFGSSKLQRIQLTGLSAVGKSTKVTVYLDDVEIGKLTLKNQEKENNWENSSNINLDVTDQNITGSHVVKINVCQYDKNQPKDSGTAEIFLKDIQFVAETIPLLTIDIDESRGTIEDMNDDPDHNTKCYGDITISVPEDFEGTYDTSYTGGTYEMEYIKGRGNSTWSPNTKHPYKIKLDKKADLFGMGSDKHWALIANAMDGTLARNDFTYKLGKELGMTYTPVGVSVDVVMNGEYLGSYYLCETVRIDESRVDIDNLDNQETDDDYTITGGYLLGTAFYGANEGAYEFTTNHGMQFNVTSPEDTTASAYESRCAYIESFIERVENAIYGEPNPDTGEVEDVFDLIDLDSAVSYYWVQELSANGDFLDTGSTYCYKVRGGKLYFGPLWDFDIAWQEAYNTEGIDGRWTGQRKWFRALLGNETFYNAAVKYWSETLKPTVSAMVEDEGEWDSYINQILYSATNNNVTWKGGDAASVRDSFLENANETKQMIRDKIEWVDSNMDSFAPIDINVIFKSEGEVVKETTCIPTGNITGFPSNPKPKDSAYKFDGWYATYTDEAGKEVTTSVTPWFYPDLYMCEEVEGKYFLEVNAKFVKADVNKRVTKVYFEQSQYNFFIPSSGTVNSVIHYSTYPEAGDTDEIEWSIDDPTVARFAANSGQINVTPLKIGSTNLNATLPNGKTFTVKVNVVETPPVWNYPTITAFDLSTTSLSMVYGQTKKLSIKNIEPANYVNIADNTGSEFNWYSDNTKIASINCGTVYSHEVGQVTVAARNISCNVLKFCTITITPKKAVIKKVSVGKNKITIKASTKAAVTGGTKYQIKYKMKGSSKWKTVTTKLQSKTIKKLKKGKKYYFKIRALKKVNGVTYYGKWSKAKLSAKVK